MTTPWFVWSQAAFAALGLLCSGYTLVEALLDYRVLRRCGLNGARKALTTGEVVSEALRVSGHCAIVLFTLSAALRVGPTPRRAGSFVLAWLTVTLVIGSFNSIIARRRVVAALEHEAQHA